MKKDIYKIKRLSENKMSNIIWQDGQKELICNLYINGESINSISRKFGGELHYNTIRNILVNNNIPLRTRSQSRMLYKKDSSIFNNIDTEEKAYWLGVLSADGFIGKNKDMTGTNIISLTSKDKDLVEKFKNFIKTNQNISYNKDMDVWNLRFQDKEMATDLVKHGLYNHKSLTLKPPLIPKEFEYHYIRGYFDGDGGVNVSKEKNRIQMYFTGTEEVISWIKEHLLTSSKIFKEHRCTNNTYRLQINGTNYCKENFDRMYKNSNENIRMDRKFNIFNNYFNEHFNK